MSILIGQLAGRYLTLPAPEAGCLAGGGAAAAAFPCAGAGAAEAVAVAGAVAAAGAVAVAGAVAAAGALACTGVWKAPPTTPPRMIVGLCGKGCLASALSGIAATFS
ncbi:hypothetical protein EN784_25985 [bacterium M00.F.Ca.ET.141.01.1.1]|nr:hypothetical protein EN842_47840 [bacterium M00.F.Ca.ET.199.01.1.1]TGS43136.1 hypothetical protein EN825_20635 [Mesorhizobium sp. M8A.F.Ca.ET.182.01.1.1]TGS80139.1 hypothetical protein EN824_18050 [Mesorhizobium sp. M8A.F.Ca.ET.181.01.1.1]TGV56735.1 hypothetical protein EN784_25985 [bacterium M00.F.Ca.ET.141.01.1.1]TGV90863.1 hypothetical protein EN792_003545 [Mesorhizobium sp. M00.F.Ca.ET.149.01.1.1]TIT51942.1 MAG: hypothetical protein E5W75_06415 [Mesorhizobium sp.]